MRILGADRHAVARLGGVEAETSHDQGFAERLLRVRAREGVVELHPAITIALAEIARRHLSGGAAMKKLMVHVHQVFMHERVVTIDDLAEASGLVAFVRHGAETGRRRRGRQTARPDEDDAITFAGRIGPYAIGQLSLTDIRNVTLARRVVTPAVIAAMDTAILHRAFGQRHLAMRAAVFQRVDFALFGTND